ncbi:hypothetical protein MKZ38_003178 [Zalerion maritima]|uniref:Proteasome inhibitor PI31 subunit n=1 Tax=Zalerion maritima TaxID=339359 RepID=A0AAD5S0X4_9PEZI|nr:hypothetical protein MKZ38_003178 [Zalerion maritima]
MLIAIRPTRGHWTASITGTNTPVFDLDDMAQSGFSMEAFRVVFKRDLASLDVHSSRTERKYAREPELPSWITSYRPSSRGWHTSTVFILGPIASTLLQPHTLKLPVLPSKAGRPLLVKESLLPAKDRSWEPPFLASTASSDGGQSRILQGPWLKWQQSGQVFTTAGSNQGDIRPGVIMGAERPELETGRNNGQKGCIASETIEFSIVFAHGGSYWHPVILAGSSVTCDKSCQHWHGGKGSGFRASSATRIACLFLGKEVALSLASNSFGFNDLQVGSFRFVFYDGMEVEMGNMWKDSSYSITAPLGKEARAKTGHENRARSARSGVSSPTSRKALGCEVRSDSWEHLTAPLSASTPQAIAQATLADATARAISASATASRNNQELAIYKHHTHPRYRSRGFVTKMANPLSPQSILQSMVEALPTHPTGDTTSDVSSSYEAIALFCHACMVNLDFRLLGFSEDTKSESECAKLAPRLPAAWNSSFGSHTLVYAHSQSSMRFVLKVDRLGGKAEIRALGIGDERIHRFDVTVRDFVSSNALPVRIPFSPAAEDGQQQTEDRSPEGGLYGKLRNVFISEARMKDLADQLKLKVIVHIVPKLQKEGYEEGVRTEDDVQAEEDARDNTRRGPREPRMPNPEPEPVRPYPAADPQGQQPRRPYGDFPPPDFEDPYEINNPRGPRLPLPGQSPFNIGHDDLNPPGLGPHDPLRGSFTPGGGLPGRSGGGGMHPTFDDPMFGGPRGGSDGGIDPQMPPGARWDPVGPGLRRLGPGGGRRGANPFGGGGRFGGFGGGFL